MVSLGGSAKAMEIDLIASYPESIKKAIKPNPVAGHNSTLYGSHIASE